VIDQPNIKAAEAALMERFREWARSLGEGGMTRSDNVRYYPNRSVNALQAAYDRGDGCLLDAVTGWLAEYRYKPTPAAQRMAEIVKAGLTPWETVLLELEQPWTPFITDEHRAKLHQVIADTHDQAGRELRAREQFERDLEKWRTEHVRAPS